MLASADLNGDGLLDLVAASAVFDGPTYLTVLLGTAGGGYTSHDVQTVDATPSAMQLLDLDDDGDLDLVTVRPEADSIRVYQQVEMGIFRASGAVPTLRFPEVLASGDLDSDGRMDLVVRRYWGPRLAVHLVAPGGGLGPAREFPIEPFEPFNPREMAITDVTGDGRADLVLELSISIDV